MNVYETPHLPLALAMLCCDCDTVFQAGATACPSCTSTTMVPVESFFDGVRAWSKLRHVTETGGIR
jgi:hypothetical protein